MSIVRSLGPFNWLREWIRAQAIEAARTEVRTIHVWHDDPVRAFDEARDSLLPELRAAANLIGADVIVGRDVVLWGGKFDRGVGLQLHNGVRIYDHCRLVIDQHDSASGIVLHESVALNFGCYLDGSGGLSIGRRTILGPNVVIVTSGHKIDADIPVQSSGKEFRGVTIGDDVWIGANVVIRMGVVIGDRAVVGAGAVVTKDVPADTVVAGTPAEVIRTKKPTR